jgi:hypothetical protein
MSCDEVFDVLTRAPFPAGESHDVDVEHHLRACHDCRQLAEGLRPALDLFHEALSTPDKNLPVYQGNLPECSQPMASMRGLQPVTVSFGPWVAAAVLMVCFAGAFFLGRWTSSSERPSQVASATSVAARTVEGQHVLATLRLPDICLTAHGDTPVTVASHSARCCTECHSAIATQRSQPQAIARLAASCGACHVLTPAT